MRDDNRLHDRIKIGMVILLLALAYLLPGLGLRITKDRLRTRQDTKGSGTEAARTEEPQETASRGIILVDPGHGGRDPGMIGVDGLEGAESYRHDTFIHLYALGKVCWYIVEVECLSSSFLRYTVDKHFHMATAETVEHHLHVRPHTACFADFHTRQLFQRLAKVLGSILHLAGV